MAALRTPGSGCAWDLEQTFQTIAPYTIEEAYLFPSGSPLIHSTTKVTETDYKFFKVETEVAIR